MNLGIKVPQPNTSTIYAIDSSSGTALSIANNGTAQLVGNISAPFSIVHIVSNGTTTSALFLVTNAAVTLIKADNAVWTVTQGTAASFNVYITGSVLTIENKFGSTQTFNYTIIKSA